MPWLSVAPATGSLLAPVLGGGLTPLTLQLDFTKLTTDSDGEVGVIQITGGTFSSNETSSADDHLFVLDGVTQRTSGTFTGTTSPSAMTALPKS